MVTHEMGSLVYLLCRKACNPQHLLHAQRRTPSRGHCPQDIYPHNGKYYVISQLQNASTDGNFTIVDAKPSEKRAVQNFETSKTPTHVAVVDANHIYVRDAASVESREDKIHFYYW